MAESVAHVHALIRNKKFHLHNSNILNIRNTATNNSITAGRNGEINLLRVDRVSGAIYHA